jgi:hypothetical protein
VWSRGKAGDHIKCLPIADDNITIKNRQNGDFLFVTGAFRNKKGAKYRANLFVYQFMFWLPFYKKNSKNRTPLQLIGEPLLSYFAVLRSWVFNQSTSD